MELNISRRARIPRLRRTRRRPDLPARQSPLRAPLPAHHHQPALQALGHRLSQRLMRRRTDRPRSANRSATASDRLPTQNRNDRDPNHVVIELGRRLLQKCSLFEARQHLLGVLDPDRGPAGFPMRSQCELRIFRVGLRLECKAAPLADAFPSFLAVPGRCLDEEPHLDGRVAGVG